MAAFTSILIGVGLAIGAVGTYASIKQSREARKQAQEAARKQEGIRAETAANNSREQAIAQRQRVREERVKRAQIIAASENSGTTASSVEMGALGGMATQAGSNNGASLGMFMSGQRIGLLNQQAADLMNDSANKQSRSGIYGQLGSLGWSMFQSGLTTRNQNNKAALAGKATVG